MRANNLKLVSSVFLIALLMSGGNGLAQHVNATGAPCQRVGAGSLETQCFIAEAEAADTELSTAYDKIRQFLAARPEDQNRLQVAQQLWLQFRDANCLAERGIYAGGSGAPMVYVACIAADTRQRTVELDTMYGWLLRK